MDRVCMPSAAVLGSAFDTVSSLMTSAMQSGEFASMSSDIENNWMWLLCGVGFSVVISLVFMFMLRCLVGLIVWVSCIGSILIFVGMGVLFLYNGGAISQDAAGFLGMPTLDSSEYYNTYGYICFGIAGVLLILLLCCCNRLRLAVAVCKVAGQFIVRVCQVTLVPIFLAFLLIGIWAACLVIMVFLLSATKFVAVSDSSGSYDVFTSVESYSEDSLLRLYYFIFATLWCNALIQAIGTFVVASACCMWYYNHGANSELDSPVLRSFKMAIRYHFGSLAFGSFILAVVQFLQVMLEIFKKQAESTGADQNKCFEYVINCLRCCMACVERIVKFLNETAYIQIALRGKNFCGAAKDGFEIVWSNGMRYLIVAGVGALMAFVGKVMIAVGSTAGFYVLVTFVPSIKDNILEPLYLLMIIFIISFTIASLFMGIYSLAIDTLLACFIVDETNQKSNGGKRALHGP